MDVCAFCADNYLAKLLGLGIKARIEICYFLFELTVQRSDFCPDFFSDLLGTGDIRRLLARAPGRLDGGAYLGGSAARELLATQYGPEKGQKNRYCPKDPAIWADYAPKNYGGSFSGQNLSAMVSLTITTGSEPFPSLVWKARPRTTGMATVSK